MMYDDMQSVHGTLNVVVAVETGIKLCTLTLIKKNYIQSYEQIYETCTCDLKMKSTNTRIQNQSSLIKKITNNKSSILQINVKHNILCTSKK